MKKEIKIICTLGPASMKDWVIARLAESGANLLRINLSHTELQDLADIIRFIQNRTSVPICLDTEGAQIRTGNLLDGKTYLRENSIVRVPGYAVPGDSHNLNLYPMDIINELEIGDFISIDFKAVLAHVVDKESDCVVMRILAGGLVGQNKAVTVERDIVMPPLTMKDREALAIGAEMGIGYVAPSFMSQASDLDKVRAISGQDVFVISKIESLRGVTNLEEIAAESDALLLDRGDLSRQVPIERIPRLQKDVIHRARKSGAKIYVATNLLESMITIPSPTRAEVNDIFNTLNDGADGLVLAAETAIGAYPVHCVTMVSRIIKQFLDFPNGYSLEELQRKDFFLLVEPHGGILANRVNADFDTKNIKGCKTIKVKETVLSDAEQIAIGTFSPLEGFMNKKELESVLRDYRLPNGEIWPLPIVLQTGKEEAQKLEIGDKITLADENTGKEYAILYLDDIYTNDLDRMARETFGTDDLNHPGVQLLKKQGEYFLGGKIELIKRWPSEYKHFEMTPRQVRTIFETKGWSKVLGFHTRNVVHRVHEHIQMAAFEKYNCDGLFLHPVVGPKKKGDYCTGVIVKSYELMIDKYYPEGKAFLSAFQSYSRYAGPREAVFTALCRKNFGCSHFLIGRDHTGVGSYYGPDDARKLFDYLGDIGIVPIFFGEVHYCAQCNAYIEQCEHGSRNILSISGTEGRKMLASRESPPDWFMRKDISNLVSDELEKGSEVFVR